MRPSRRQQAQRGQALVRRFARLADRFAETCDLAEQAADGCRIGDVRGWQVGSALARRARELRDEIEGLLPDLESLPAGVKADLNLEIEAAVVRVVAGIRSWARVKYKARLARRRRQAS